MKSKDGLQAILAIQKANESKCPVIVANKENKHYLQGVADCLGIDVEILCVDEVE